LWHFQKYQTSRTDTERLLPFPDEEPFASCFADKMDMSKCRPVSPEELAELNRTLGVEYHVNFKS
ncbi:MAG: hypothetical protein Q4G57_06565, partial [Bacillota bacterium]|nr:hypothetical protein [Bacillota bacterium]